MNPHVLWVRRVFLLAVAVLAGTTAFAAVQPVRVEAHSTELLAVALVQGDRMIVHLSRVLDNSPVRDAALTVVLRGASYPAVAQTDGSYLLTAKDLALPGNAAVEFNVSQGGERQTLKGVLKADAAAEPPDDHGNARQMWWWALNFGVCAGFLVLWSRRKKDAES